ncbi:MAG: alpha/beta hydrolase [Candidatus Omnitrophota bacterium]
MRFFLGCLAAIVLLVTAIRLLERFSIYFPIKTLEEDPRALGLSYEDVYFETADRQRLNGWYFPVPGAAETLLFFHGNAGNISHRLEKIVLLRKLGLSVFIFDYRGYGKSQGTPSETGFYRDADAAYEYLTKKRGLSAAQVLFYGESIGGAVAVDLASRKEVKAIITEETFPSVKDMVPLVLRWVPPFVFGSKFDSLSKIRSLRCPKLILHSQDDEIVPYALGEKLFEAAGPPKRFLRIRGGHNTAFLESERAYLDGIGDFLKDLPRNRQE